MAGVRNRNASHFPFQRTNAGAKKSSGFTATTAEVETKADTYTKAC
jgi:hypothetical protein